ncbi:MAG: ATP-binding protein, partial [Actinomycetes bacterium]
MSTALNELELSGEADAVPRARRFVRESLAEAPAEQCDDAELVVAELVTNAILHGAPPVTLRVQQVEDAARIEVHDTGRQRPIAVRGGVDSMTGRGLALVGSLTREWGVHPTADGGKVVWAEVPESPMTAETGAVSPLDVDDLDAVLASWDDLDDGEEVFAVALGAVPTELLLDAKAQIDNVVRELTLAGAGAGEETGQLSAELAELVQIVVHDFADARLQITQQALAAAARDEPSPELRLTLPAAAADAGERYLTALDEADRYARGARLLTLETPPVHRVLREWYVGALVARLRAAAAGEPPPDTSSFAERLAVEVAELAPLREVSQRLRLLQRVTAELTGTQTTEDVVST